MNHEAYILAGIRTPIGAFNGTLAGLAAPALGAAAIQAVVEKATIPANEVGEVLFGNVVSAGIGQNPARQASIRAGIPSSVGATTINKVCGSGLKAVMLATQSIELGHAQAIVAGGMESMSGAPYLLTKARQGYRIGHDQIVDAMIRDGLWDVYGDESMGTYGDLCASKYSFSREAQDDYAVRSYTRARQAAADGVFASEIVPVEIPGRKGTMTVTEDEEPVRFDEAKLRRLRPAFGADGTVTAGNASSINDGAAAVVVASGDKCAQLGIEPLARIVGAATFAQEPSWFTTAPIGSIKALLETIGWSADQVDLFEINEAFAVVAMATEKELNIPPEKINIYGGAVALGHPIGATGARILVTLMTALQRTGGRRGVASICIGGGEAVAVAVETASA